MVPSETTVGNRNVNVMELFDLKGKIALVTGASYGGLGYYSAEALAEAGAEVSVCDLPTRLNDLKITANRVKEIRGRSHFFDMDVANPVSVAKGIEKVEKEFGKIDILLNNAGVMLRKPSLETSLEEWENVIRINLTGTWLVDNEVARSMIKQGNFEGRRIINVSSGYATMVGPLPEASYVASKAGIANLTRDLAMEWAKFGINVNAIAPGVFYPTNMTRPLANDPEMLKFMSNRTLKKRLGDPKKDLKGIVVFLASDASEYVTGQIIYVDGGWNAW